MFDWPEQTHTSPIITFFRIITLLPFSVTVYGPPAAGVSTISFHFASRVAVIESVLLFHEVVTNIFSPGLPHPHKATDDCCCSTMLSAITEGNRISAKDVSTKNKTGR